MIVVSLVVNIAVLLVVGGSLIVQAGWVRTAYGDRSPARDILLAMYLAILASSLILLVGELWLRATWMLGAVIALLGVQVVYKLLTALTVQSALRNPVVISNLGIAAVHMLTIAVSIPMLQ